MSSKLAPVLTCLLVVMSAVFPATSCTMNDEIRVGAVMDITGSLFAIGTQIRDGVVLAVNQINATGGIGGRRVKLYVEDGRTSPEDGLSAVKKLVEVDDCKIIIGPMTSSAVLASGDYALQQKVILISPLSSSVNINAQPFRQFVFRTSPSDALQGQCMVKLVLDGGYKKVAILAINNDYGTGLVKVFNSALADKVNIVANITYDPDKLDYLTELQIIKDHNPDCVIHVGYVTDAEVVYKQSLQLGLGTAQWVASVGVYSDATLTVPEAAQFMESCVIGTRPTNPEKSPAYTTFAKAYKAAFDSDPGVYSGNSYDAANLAFDAMKNVGTSDTTKIAAEILRISNGYVGVSGLLTMTSTGDRISGDFEVWKVVKDGLSYSYVRVKDISPS